jgi:hypothetical protein
MHPLGYLETFVTLDSAPAGLLGWLGRYLRSGLLRDMVSLSWLPATVHSGSFIAVCNYVCGIKHLFQDLKTLITLRKPLGP